MCFIYCLVPQHSRLLCSHLLDAYVGARYLHATATVVSVAQSTYRLNVPAEAGELAWEASCRS